MSPDRQAIPSYDPATGAISIGEDDSGRCAYWKLHGSDMVLRNGLIVGRSRSGKSNLIRSLIAGVWLSGRLDVWLGDPSAQMGFGQAVLESGLLMRHAQGEAETSDLLLQAERAVAMRRAQERPVFVVIDDAEDVFATDARATAAAEYVAREGVRHSFGLIAATSHVNLAFFGGRHDLRRALARDNAVALGVGSEAFQPVLQALQRAERA